MKNLLNCEFIERTYEGMVNSEIVRKLSGKFYLYVPSQLEEKYLGFDVEYTSATKSAKHSVPQPGIEALSKALSDASKVIIIQYKVSKYNVKKKQYVMTFIKITDHHLSVFINTKNYKNFQHIKDFMWPFIANSYVLLFLSVVHQLQYHQQLYMI